MPYIRVWIHYVWATKRREKTLLTSFRGDVIEHMTLNARKKEIFLDCINGVEDHLHALVSLGSDQTIAKVAQLMKGESSFWVNKQKWTRGKFEWQDDYFAVSVSESQVNAVRTYIRNQEPHHRKKTFREEYEDFLHKYGSGIVNRDEDE